MKKLGYILGILILGLFILVWCDSQKKTIEDKIEDYILDSCYFESDSCFLNLNKFVPVPWDTMAIFGEYTLPSKIEETLNIHYNGEPIQPNFHRMIFVKNGKVVYEETLENLPEGKRSKIKPFTFKQLGNSIGSPIYDDSIYIIKRTAPYNKGNYGEYFYFLIPLSKNKYVEWEH